MQIRQLQVADRAQWQVLWAAYQDFYNMEVKADTTELTWMRFHDANAPLYALGAFSDGKLIGIVHFLFHLSSTTTGPYCYLQDLFTSPSSRRQGVGSALIEAVYERASQEGASRVYWLTHETNAEAIKLYEKLAQRSGFIQYRKLLA